MTIQYFLNQIYQQNPELSKYENLIVEYLRNNLQWKTSFVVDDIFLNELSIYISNNKQEQTIESQTNWTINDENQEQNNENISNKNSPISEKKESKILENDNKSNEIYNKKSYLGVVFLIIFSLLSIFIFLSIKFWFVSYRSIISNILWNQQVFAPSNQSDLTLQEDWNIMYSWKLYHPYNMDQTESNLLLQFFSNGWIKNITWNQEDVLKIKDNKINNCEFVFSWNKIDIWPESKIIWFWLDTEKIFVYTASNEIDRDKHIFNIKKISECPNLDWVSSFILNNWILVNDVYLWQDKNYIIPYLKMDIWYIDLSGNFQNKWSTKISILKWFYE